VGRRWFGQKASGHAPKIFIGAGDNWENRAPEFS
jgi:hypothetical protein